MYIVHVLFYKYKKLDGSAVKIRKICWETKKGIGKKHSYEQNFSLEVAKPHVHVKFTHLSLKD